VGRVGVVPFAAVIATGPVDAHHVFFVTAGGEGVC